MALEFGDVQGDLVSNSRCACAGSPQLLGGHRDHARVHIDIHNGAFLCLSFSYLRCLFEGYRVSSKKEMQLFSPDKKTDSSVAAEISAGLSKLAGQLCIPRNFSDHARPLPRAA
jgi:hypothetical protein